MTTPPELPDGYHVRAITPDDIDSLAELLARYRRHYGRSDPVDRRGVLAETIGLGSWTRRQVVVTDPQREIVVWAALHDRAAGRSDLYLTVDPDCPDADQLGIVGLEWLERTAVEVARWREVDEVRLELLVSNRDGLLRSWAQRHGHHLARTWLNMSRQVTPAEEVPAPRPGVTVRRVGVHDLGDGTTMPDANDLRSVHRVLERSFEDHFNSYRENFAEFVQRLREDPGHRWDHWWIADVEVDGRVLPGGAVVSTVAPPDDTGQEGSYIDYIGVDRVARGRGVAKALLNTVIADAAERGRNRVGLEVDAESPTGADGLYSSLGWQTTSTTESWHKDLVISH